jgi:hypothetical protein
MNDISKKRNRILLDMVHSEKLSSKFDKCVFVRYPKETKWYYFYYMSENKIVVVRHAVFMKK